MPRVMRSGESEGIADGIDFLPDLKMRGVAERHGLKVGRFDLDDGEIVRAVGADDGGAIFLAVAERDFDLPGFGDHVVVGEDVAFFVDDEAGALTFLRDQSVEEVVGHGARGDVDDRRRCSCDRR